MSSQNRLRQAAVIAFLWAVAGCRPMPPMGQSKPPSKRTVVRQEMVYTDKTPEEWIELLGHNNPQVRERAIDALVQYGEKSVRPLVRLLEGNASSHARLGAVRALGEIGGRARAAVPQLIRLLHDRQWSGRDAVADALARIEASGPEEIAALVSALKEDPDERVRAKVASALGRLRAAGAASVAALAGALEDADATVQAAAAEALGRLGPAAKSALPALEKAAGSDQFIVNQAAQEAIRSITGQ